MPAGRVGRPTALKMVAGEKPSRINDDEPQPEPGIPRCPSNDREVMEVWNYTIRQLLVMRVLTMADRDTLHAYCEQVVLHRRALQVIADEGAFFRTPLGSRRHPAVGVAKEAATMMKTLGAHFGLTPSSRTQIKVADSKPERPQGAGRLLTG